MVCPNCNTENPHEARFCLACGRLQSQAPVNGIAVGEKTYLETRETIAYEETEPVVAKGKADPVRAWVAMHALTEAGERPVGERAIVGRKPELSLLRALWDRVRE